MNLEELKKNLDDKKTSWKDYIDMVERRQAEDISSQVRNMLLRLIVDQQDVIIRQNDEIIRSLKH